MSITSRITSMEEHISEAYDELQGLGADLTNVNKNIENISSVLDTIYDSMPQVSGEGTSITLDNTRVGKIKTTLKGNTSQNGTPTPDTPIPVNVVSGDNSVVVYGRNLFNIDNILLPSNAYTRNGNELTIYNGVRNFYDYDFEENTQYTIALDLKQANGTGSGRLEILYTNGTSEDIGVNNTTTYQNIIKVSNASKTIDKIRTTYGSSGSFSVKNIIIVKGNEPTLTYEPYTGATYPINLPVENLFNINGTKSNTGCNVSISGNELIQTNTETYSRSTWAISNLTIGKSYTLSFSYNNSSASLIEAIIRNSTDTSNIVTTTATTNTSGKETLTFTPTETSCYIRLYSNVSNTSNTSVVKFYDIQLEEGTKQNSFTPYGTTPIELCKIPNTDYEDTFIHDKTLDKWYWHREINKIIFNGTQTFQSTSLAFLYSTYLGSASIDSLSSHFVYSSAWSSSSADYRGKMNINSDRVRFMPLDSSINTLELWYSWLSSHNVSFYYPLETPTDTEITYQPLIEQLNNIEKAMSYNGQTNISQVNNDLPFIISASALKEWQESTSLSMSSPLLGSINTIDLQPIENDIQPLEINEEIEPLEEEEYGNVN